jgi:hypothetical protein
MDWLGDFGAAFFGALYDYRIAVLVASLVAALVLAIVAWRRGWIGAARRHPRSAIAVLAVALTVGLPLAWYTASPLVLTASIDEPPPVITVRPSAASGLPSPSMGAARPSAPSPTVSASPSPTSSASHAPTPIASHPPTLLIRTGTFHGSDDFHFGRGTARLLEVEPGSFVVRLEDFAVRNGPDLYVYLSSSANGYAKGAIELGRLKADTGNQNYRVPDGVLDDPSSVASVVIWCKQFSHLFATAPLAN